MTSRKKVFVLVIQLVAVLGCGGGAVAPRDAGVEAPGDGSAEVPPATGLRAFDVMAVLTPERKGALGLPPSSAFTVVLDVGAGHLIVGGMGTGAVVPVATADGRTFKATGPAFAVGTSAGTSCSIATGVSFQAFEITVTGTMLRGTASGLAQISCGDCFLNEAFTAVLEGVADVKPPSLLTRAVPETPFEGFSMVASEPLPASAKARLVAGDGSTVELQPNLTETTPPLIVGFRKPDVVLRPGDDYTVSAVGLVDFVGNAGTDARLTSFSAAPLVPEDGFESAVGATVGGANLIRSGPLAPITGTASAYVGSNGSPSAGDVVPSFNLDVRLALQPGDTKLRFAYRVASFEAGVPFAGTVQFGSVGHTPSPSTGLAGAMASVTLPGGRQVFVSPVATAEFALPADAQGELIVSFTSSSGATCLGFQRSPSAVLIDDLRVE